MRTYRVTFSDGSVKEIRAKNEERAVFDAINDSHLHIVKVEELVPVNVVGEAGDS